MKSLFPIALLVLMPAIAQADLITETTGPLSQTVNSASNGSFQEVDLPAFNQGLGTLTGATISIDATVFGDVINLSAPLQPPSMVSAEVSLAFTAAIPVAFPSQFIEVPEFDNMASVSASFAGTFAAASLGGFTDPGGNFFVPAPDIFIQSLFGADTESTTTIDFDITETLTYTPIPEPASIILFAAGLGALGAAVRKRGVSSRLSSG